MSTPCHVRRSPDEILLAFTHALRAAGLALTPDRAQGFLDATALVGLEDRRATACAGRATLCSSPDDLIRFDQVFDAFFNARDGLPRARRTEPSSPAAAITLADAEGTGEGEQEEIVHALASPDDVLRHRDVAALEAHEKRLLDRMFATLTLRPPTRRTARHQRWHRGEIDRSRTLRSSLQHFGEPAEINWRRPRLRARRIILLVDVSGSMSGYADALLRLAHRFTQSGREVGATVETFTIGTRLTHITRAMRNADPDRALMAAGDTVPDWAGGTRLGETLRVFLDRWGQRGLARGSVTVIFSDGWERGEPDLLREQMRRLRRVAHRVIWVNPHRGKAGYEPVQQGVLAALPFCDDFVAGHSLASFSELTRVIAHA